MTVPRLLLSPPDVGQLEEEYVLRAMRSGWVAPTGPEVTAFEQETATRAGVAHGVALSSGTAALHLAMLGIGVGLGDVVIVPTMTFVASANAVVYTGAEPCFVDVLEDGNLDPDLLAETIDDVRRRGRRVGAVMSVDLLGRTADYGRITKVCEQAEVTLIEDAAEALGAHHDGRQAGSFGVASALSFNGNKIMTTSGGGMLLTGDAGLAEHARFLSTQAREPVLHFEHKHVGYNYRMSNVLAALGRGQLVRLDGMISRRREIRATYAGLVRDWAGVSIFQPGDSMADNCWLTAILVDEEITGISSHQVIARLEAVGIESRPLWKPMHLQPVFHGALTGLTGRAEHLFARGVALPSGSVHAREAIDRVCSALTNVFGRST
jgi:dTDP-4-amino-4,6-dideoxygalactose transaminase